MNKILFLGQKKIGEYAFKLLLNSQNDQLKVMAACSNINTDIWWKSNEIYKLCQRANIAFVSNSDKNESQLKKIIEKLSIDTIISVQHPWIISKQLLEIPKYKAFNLHNAKLPDYKGCNAVNHAILNREKVYTSTIHWMLPKVDTGPIAYENTFEIPHNVTAQKLYIMAEKAGLKIFEKLIQNLSRNLEIPKKYFLSKGRYYTRKSIESLREIKNLNDPLEIQLKARAFFFPPFEPAYFIIEKNKYFVLPDDVCSEFS